MKDNGEIDALANYVGLQDDSALHILDDHGLLNRQKVRGIAIAHYYGKEKKAEKGARKRPIVFLLYLIVLEGRYIGL